MPHDQRPAPGCTTRVVWWIEEAQTRGFLPTMDRMSLSAWRVVLRDVRGGGIAGSGQRGGLEDAFAVAMIEAMGGGWKPPREAMPDGEAPPEPDPLAEIPM